MSEMLTFGEQVLASQPFSVLMGARLTVWTPEQTELVIPVRDDLKQQYGFLHGGVVSYAADNAMAFAGGAAFGQGVVTQEFKINYVRPAVGEALIARATATAVGKRQAVCRCEVYVVQAGEEKLCALAQGTIAPVDRGPK